MKSKRLIIKILIQNVWEKIRKSKCKIISFTELVVTSVHYVKMYKSHALIQVNDIVLAKKKKAKRFNLKKIETKTKYISNDNSKSIILTIGCKHMQL